MKKTKKLSSIFLQGLVAIVPIAITVYILFWLVQSTELLFGGMLKPLLPDKYYIPGMGVITGLIIVMGVGALLRFWVFKKLFDKLEKIFSGLPIIKSLYGSVQDLMSFFDTTKKKEFSKVVIVDLIGNGTKLIGFVTREDFEGLPETLNDKQTIAVYLPMSYQLGGFTVFVDKSKIKAVNMSVEEAMRFIFTAAMSTKTDKVSV